MKSIFRTSLLLVPIVLTVLLINVQFAIAQAHNWTYAQHCVQNKSVDFTMMEADHEGNSFVAGYFFSLTTTVFDETFSKSSGSLSDSDLFLVKLDAKGEVLWTAQPASDGDERVWSAAVDPDGSIYITGQFNGAEMDFDGTIISSQRVGIDDTFLAKYNAAGVLEWATALPLDFTRAIAVAPNGNIYLSGNFRAPTITIDNVVLQNNSSNLDDSFVFCLDANRNALWGYNTESNTRLFDLATDSQSNLYIGSSLLNDEVVTFNNLVVDLMGSDSFASPFLVKLDPQGNGIWKRQPIANKAGSPFSLAQFGSLHVTENDQVVMGGYYIGNGLAIDTFILGDTSTNEDLLFALSFTTDGDLNWANSIGGDDRTVLESISSRNEQVFISARTFSSSISENGLTLSDLKDNDLVLAELDETGEVTWMESYSGSESEIGALVSASASGVLFYLATQGIEDLEIGPFILESGGNPGRQFLAIMDLNYPTGLSESVSTGYTQVLLAYPNPSADGSFSISNISAEQATGLRLTNLLGQEIPMNAVLTADQQVSIQLPNAQTGMYLLTAPGMANSAVRLVVDN